MDRKYVFVQIFIIVASMDHGLYLREFLCCLLIYMVVYVRFVPCVSGNGSFSKGTEKENAEIDKSENQKNRKIKKIQRLERGILK